MYSKAWMPHPGRSGGPVSLYGFTCLNTLPYLTLHTQAEAAVMWGEREALEMVGKKRKREIGPRRVGQL